MKHFFIYLFIVTCTISHAQNLVPNPSFEEYIACPNGGGQLEKTLYWTNPLIGSTPDYLNSCGIQAWNVPKNNYGYEPARSGVAYAAIVTANYSPFAPQIVNNSREYLQVELLDTLKTGVNYCFGFFVSAGDSMHYVSNNIGIYFSKTEIRDTCSRCNLKYNPQFENDSLNDLSSRDGWTEVSGIYAATGGEKFIVIGNFRDTTTTIATYVGWSNIQSYFQAIYYIDDVFLYPCLTNGVVNDNTLLSVYPNPNNGYFFLEIKNEVIKMWEVYNSTGQFISHGINSDLSNKIPINITEYQNGIYILTVLTSCNTKFIFKLFKT